MGATPTPWELDQMGNIWKRGDTKVAHLSDHPLQAQLYREQSAEERLANANLIVTAVNNHAALVMALKEAQTVLAMMIDPETIRSTTAHHAWAQAVAAEQKARAALSAASASETGKGQG